MLNYLISISKNEELSDGTIHDVDSKLKVKAFDPLLSASNPCNGELTYFVTTKTKTLAFETIGYKNHKKLLILQMISWYCAYLGYFEATIHQQLPH